MTTLNTQSTVGAWVAEQPSRARIFESIGIDYCCGGKKSLALACAALGLDDNTVMTMLKAIDTTRNSTGNEADVDAANMSMTELADHIEQTHHAFLRRELPRLTQMIAKVLSVHGADDARLAKVAQVFAALKSEMENHMMKEEHILFPLCRSLESAAGPQSFHCGSVANPIHVMEMEHASAGDALSTLSELTDRYTPPQTACNTWRALLSSLEEIEQDMHRHVHKENNILFPRAIQREGALRGVDSTCPEVCAK